MLENLFNKINNAVESYNSEMETIDTKVKQELKENAVPGVPFSDEQVAKIKENKKSEFDEMLTDKVAQSLNEFESNVSKNIEELQQQLNPEGFQEEKNSQTNRAANKVSMLKPEQIPGYLNNIENKAEREEFISYAKIKLSDKPALQKELSQQIINSMSEEEKSTRQQLAKNKSLLDNLGYFNNKTYDAADKIITGDNPIKNEPINNLNNSFGDRNKEIENKVDRLILEQF